MEIIKKLQDLQKESGKTSYQIAKETGLSKNNVYELLDNKNLNPKISTLNKIGKIFGITLKWTKL